MNNIKIRSFPAQALQLADHSYLLNASCYNEGNHNGQVTQAGGAAHVNVLRNTLAPFDIRAVYQYSTE